MNLFTKGQLIFALLFVVCFIVVLFIAYKKDAKLHKKYYEGSTWLFIILISIISLLVTLKFIFA